jgi:hypothetical protein
MEGIAPIGAPGGTGGIGGAWGRVQANLMLDTLQAGMGAAGVPLSADSKNALQQLRDLINGRQQQAANDVAPGEQAPAGAQGAGSPSPSSGEGEQGLMQVVAQLLQAIAQLLQQLQQGQGQGQGDSQGSGVTPLAGQFADSDLGGFGAMPGLTYQ